MEMDSHSYLNSPVIQKHTPIRRLGLSRKRKSSGSVGEPNDSFRLSSGKNFRLDEKTKGGDEPELDDAGKIIQLIDYKKEIEALKTKISEKEEKLKTFQHNDNSNINYKKILELEELVKVWKTGCENAYLELMRILKDKEPDISNKDVLNELGIRETISKHFEQGSDFFL